MLERSGNLTDQGRQWLLKALDPYHDRELRAADIPYGAAQRVVVQEVDLSTTITTPNNDVWDCHIAILQDLMKGITNANGTQTADGLSGMLVSPGQMQYGGPNHNDLGVSYCATNVGDTTFENGAANALALTPWNKINGRSRIIGVAFEVHNITEDLYRSGSVTCYRTSGGEDEDTLQIVQKQFQQSGLILNAPLKVPVIRRSAPPTIEEEAVLMPGSKQWSARDGCYVVGVIDTLEKQGYRSWDSTARVYVSPYKYGKAFSSGQTSAMGKVDEQAYANDSGTMFYPTVQYQFFSTGMRCSGAYFTGLSKETKLKLNAKFLVACQPDSDDPLLTLAYPGGPRDDTALTLYSRAVEKLPAGVAVRNNAAGDWFRDVLGTLAHVAPAVGSAFGPKGVAIGMGLGALSATLSNVGRKKQANGVVVDSSRDVSLAYQPMKLGTRRKRKAKAQRVVFKSPRTGRK